MKNIITFDQELFSWFNSFINQNTVFDTLIKFLTVYLVYCVPIGLIVAWFLLKNDKKKIILIKTTLASIFMWQVPTRIISMLWYRPRPIAELVGSKELVFHVPSYSFPSDHSTFIAALGTYFYLCGFKKTGVLIYTASILVGTSRVIAGLHYPGDVLCGWILGTIGAIIIYQFDKYLEKYLALPILKIMKKIKLA